MTHQEVQKKIKQERLQKSRTVLAKLLASENVHVTFDSNATTASFQTEKRVLTLPTLNDMESFHYDGFVAHEVAHAIFTPALTKDDMKKLEEQVPFHFVNVTEDARIEKLIQNRYPGLKKDFYDMYKDFSSPERNFFGVDGQDISKLTTIDKINLFFKAGRFLTVPFRPEEKIFVEKVSKTKTFEDAVKVAKEIYDFMKKDNQQQKQSQQNGGGSGQDGDDGDFVDGNGNSAGFTQQEFEKNRKKLMEDNKKGSNPIQYGEGINSGDIKVEDFVKTSVMDKLKKQEPLVKDQFDRFLNQIKPTVNMMVAQFNMRKAASDWNKTREAKTGSVNTKRLAKYKITNNIFKSNEIYFEEKNHGMVMVIDWSASMSGVIHNTVKQLIVVLEFCKRVQIPYEVYGFTDGGHVSPKSSTAGKIRGGNPTIFKMIDSTVKSKEYKNIIGNLYHHTKNDINYIHHMHQTPLKSTALMMDIVVEKFKEKYKREKVVLLLLSDGEPTDELFKDGHNYGYGTIVLNDKFTAKNYTVNTYHDVFRYVKERNNVSSMIGIYLASNISKGNVERVYDPDFKGNFKKHETEFQNKKYTVFEDGKSFDKFFVVNINQFDFKNTAQKNFDSMSKYASKQEKIDKVDALVQSNSKPMIFMKIFIDAIS